MNDLILISELTCPRCNATEELEMPTDACQWFWTCPSCEALISPEKGDCCVFCSYGTAPCPSVQLGNECGKEDRD